jgi:hypothetical protein
MVELVAELAVLGRKLACGLAVEVDGVMFGCVEARGEFRIDSILASSVAICAFVERGRPCCCCFFKRDNAVGVRLLASFLLRYGLDGSYTGD